MESTHRLTRARRWAARAFVAFLPIALCGACATTFEEHHYYQALDPKTEKVTNYYRLTVRGYAAMSSARYISGYYDERAVDLYFNEVKVAQTPEGATSTQELFSKEIKDPGTQEVIKPLSPDSQHGAFVMILSTNASNVSRTIGQFAENQVVADAITNLANRDVLLQTASVATARAGSANATADEVSRLIALLPDGTTPTAKESEASLLRILNAIGTGIEGHPVAFESLDQAAAWQAQSTSEQRLP